MAKKTTTTTRNTKKSKSTTAKRTSKATTARKATTKTTKLSQSFAQLNSWNKVLGVVYLVQALVLLLAAKAYILPVTVNYLTNDPLASAGGKPVMAAATRTLFSLNFVHVVVAFLLIAAVAHIIVATVYRARYEAGLQQHRNIVRWIEYAVGGGVTMMAVAMLSGVQDLASLVMIFVLTEVASLARLLVEAGGPQSPTKWVKYMIAGKGALVPWFVLLAYVIGTNVYGNSSVPGFLYGIYATLLVSVVGFGYNMYMQYYQKGKWADYVYSERIYMVLSLLAGSAIAWQIFFGILR